MFNRKEKNISVNPKIDLHSHLIPGVDDGVKTIKESIEILLEFKKLGYEKAITTPHIHPSYPNNAEVILKGLDAVQKELKREKIEFEIEAAAEYFVDEIFLRKVKSGEEILSFGDRYVLIESSFINKPLFFEECIFELKSRSYRPILAHPERYRFLEGELDWLMQLKEIGIDFQVTISSFAGFYGSMPQEIAKRLEKKGMIDFLGSDMHNHSHIKYLKKGLERKEVRKLIKTNSIRNTTLQ